MSNSNPYTKSPIHITQGTGKMLGIVSINSSTLSNPFCQKMKDKPGLICGKCYARTYESIYSALRGYLESNSRILSSAPLSDEDIPVIYQDICRVHSFGELQNEMHLENICRIAIKNSHCLFTLWTKRLNLISPNRPSNLNVIYSNPKLDSPISAVPLGVDGVFNVLTAEYAISHNIKSNCPGHCRMCMKCYRSSPAGVIYEILKSDQKKYKEMME